MLSSGNTAAGGSRDHAQMPLGRVDNSAQLTNAVGSLHLKAELSDTIFYIKDEAFPAHSLILASQSSYFKALFKDQLQKSVVVIQNANSDVFRGVLEYFYTGRLNLVSTVVHQYGYEVLQLARQFHLDDLARSIVDDMCAHVLLADEVDDLSGEVVDFLDAEAESVIACETFRTLSAKSIRMLLERDEFFVRQELDVFKAVRIWSDGRAPHKEKEESSRAFGVVRLPLIPHEELLHEVQPSGSFSDSDIIEAMKMQSAASNIRRRKPKVIPITVPDQNVASTECGTKVTSGRNPEALFSEHQQETAVDFTWHQIEQSEKQEGIQVQLDKVYNINMLKLHIESSADNRIVSYYVAVRSHELNPWTTVVDHTSYHCCGHQSLYFPVTAVRYLKIVGTASSTDDVFAVVSLECHCVSRPLPTSEGFLQPATNQALTAAGALILSGRPHKGRSMLDGAQAKKGCTYCRMDENIEVCLPQPVLVGSLRFRLWDLSECFYSYYVEVSADRETWTRVGDKTGESGLCRSWQRLYFDERPVSFLRFTGVESTCEGEPMKTFHIVYLECPALDTMESASCKY